MLRSLHFFRYGLISLGLHGLLLAALYFFLEGEPASFLPVPVQVVNLPPEVTKRLPPVARPVRPPIVRDLTPLEKDSPFARPRKVPGVSVPAVTPEYGHSEGSNKGKSDAGKKGSGATERGKGPLPFLSQNDIDDLAKKGFPEWKLKDEPLTEETIGFKHYGYTKWFFQKVNKYVRYPELAAVSGLQGDVFVYLDILKDGTIGSIDIVKSSGYKILDDEVIRTLQAAAPYQPLPEDWNTDHYKIPIVGAFRIYYRELR